MPDDPKEKAARAAQIQKDLEEADQKRKADAKKRADGEIDLANQNLPGGVEGVPLNKLLTDLHTKIDAAMKRMDTYDDERRQRDDAAKKDGRRDDDERREGETEEEYAQRCQREGRSPAQAREVVADSNPAHRAEFADAQERAERAYTAWGMRANPPLAGEGLRAYRLRLLRPLQKHSKQYSKSDLDLLPRDEAIFGATEQVIYADSVAASSAPDSVQPGRLRTVTRVTDTGHRVTELIGQPQAWMDWHAGGSRRYVTSIQTKLRSE
jgi:hypothetical protein